MPNIWVTADTHFNHAKIIGYCNRPFSSVEEMDEAIIDTWNALVKPEDTVYHLGDVGFGKIGLQCISRCNGHKHLIRGNHDFRIHKCKFVDAGFELISDKVSFITGSSIRINHSPCKPDYRGVSFCGHVHDKWTFEDGWLNVGVDQWGFKPLHIDECLLLWTLLDNTSK